VSEDHRNPTNRFNLLTSW